MEKIIINQNFLSCVWAMGWLFTVGYLGLSFWEGVLAIITWPYHIGKYFRRKHKTSEVSGKIHQKSEDKEIKE